MTSINSNVPSFPMPQSPRARIDARIASAASAGSISQTDETALEAAVDSIGQSLRNPASTGASSTTATTGGSTAATAGSGTSFKDKLDSLIDAQVTGGTLTDAQATELKGIFAQGAPSQAAPGTDGGDGQDGTQAAGATGRAAGAGGAHHAHHHHGGGGGMAAIMAALDGSDSTDASTTTSAVDALTGTATTGSTSATTATGTTTAWSATSAVGSTDPATQQIDKLIGFLEKMRASIGSAQTYGQSSASTTGTNAAGMVFSALA